MRIRPDRHASDDELADLTAGELRRRKAAGIWDHLTRCADCSSALEEIEAVPAVLASTAIEVPPMPAHLSQRIEAALHAESLQRLAEQPAHEAERSVLPVPGAQEEPEPRWQLPRLHLPVPLLRLAGGLGVAAVLAAGGFTLANHVSTPGGQSASSGSAAEPATAPQQFTAGPEITYGPPGSQHEVREVNSGADFEPSTLAAQVGTAVSAARARGGAATSVPRANATGSGIPVAPASPLAGCVGLIARGRQVTLVDMARYQGNPATVIAVAAAAGSPAQAWVVGPACSATEADIIAHTQLG